MAIKVYHNVTTFPFLANIKLYNNKLYVTIKAPSATVEGKYTTLGTDYIPISEHSSYSIIMRNNDALYKIRDDKNSVVQSKIKLVPSNKIMMGSRMKYDEVENRYDGVSLLQIDTNTFNGNVSELQVVLFRVKKENLTFEIPTSMKVDYAEYTSSDIFKKGAKRHYFWDTYALIINGKEYRYDEQGRCLSDTAPEIKNTGEYIDISVVKYANNFTKKLERDEDNDSLVIEESSGLANTHRLKLINGKGNFRWYNFGYTGELRIKIGWRWYSGVNDYHIKVIE